MLQGVRQTIAAHTVLLACTTALLTPGEETGAPGESDMGQWAEGPHGPLYLLLESDIVDRAEGVRRILGNVHKEPGNPLFIEDKPWEARFDNLYANVLFDEEEQMYKVWYNPFILDEAVSTTPPEERNRVPYRVMRREMGVCYATSKDGVTWEKPELGTVEFNGSTTNNIVLRRVHGAGVHKDLRDPDPIRRYKLFCKSGEEGQPMAVAFSPDGLHWSELFACPEIEAAGDTHNNFRWDDALGRYVGITRLWRDQQRVVGRTETGDFLKWSKAAEVLRGDPKHQTYAMPVFRYGDVYLGLLTILHTETDTVDCELAWSRDTIHWERVCPGTPLIPRGAQGAFDSHCIYAAAYPIVRDGEIRVYYGGSNGPHGGWRNGGFGLARLRLHGFAGIETKEPGRIGRVITRPILCTGKRLHITADMTANGSVRAGVLNANGLSLADCEAIRATTTEGTVTWRTGRDLAALQGALIQLEFELQSATLYAFGFSN